MKKNNKGFSLVELIIVIAIMAILAGALAPALIKYINKSRKSADESNADVIRTAIQTAMSNEDALDSFYAHQSTGKVDSTTVASLTNESDYGQFAKELKSILGDATIKSKYYPAKGGQFIVNIDYPNNKIIVGAPDGSTPIVGK